MNVSKTRNFVKKKDSADVGTAVEVPNERVAFEE
jgi:hypothetical protein